MKDYFVQKLHEDILQLKKENEKFIQNIHIKRWKLL